MAQSKINIKDIEIFITKIGFTPKDGEVNTYNKQVKEYNFEVDFEKLKILYPDKITVHHNSAINIIKKENLVVLECVIRLIEKGYSASDIELEKDWKFGHKTKGRLDILVSNKGKAFMMIECKTFGREYNNEISKMLNDGGQLISYYPKERNAKILCLYSSDVKNNNIEYVNNIIHINNELARCSSSESFYDLWDKNFLTKGIFNDLTNAYSFNELGLNYYDLYDLGDENSNIIYNQFEEILRRNAVSDKSNAFNKIFNLFICKIVDEDTKIESYDELDFQWKPNDDYEKFFDRLNSLYKKGTKDYINIEVEDISSSDLLKLLSSENNKNQKIIEAFTKLRLYKNNEFAFKEVYNEDTFLENALIVKEIVKLLQGFRIKYNQKQQFLGDFFERLLSSGFKQEVGQYFTPLPIARFMSKSLPIEAIINKKNGNKEKYFLPYTIDYASGSGHFITEIMDEINGYVTSIKQESSFIKGGKASRDEFDSTADNYKWAKEYIYGIEKDYRLAKTTKISTFLNGDGDANIIMGDGLDCFDKSKTYIKKLKEVSDSEGVFDIVIANPPYSVKGFKNSLNNGSDAFNLFKLVSDKNGNIECFFFERTYHLLKEGGAAAIILPVSFLTSTEKISFETRKILFENFNLKACVYLGEKTFMATNVFSVILFLEKKDPYIHQNIRNTINKFLNDFKDYSCNGISNAFSKYIQYVYGEEFNITLYSDLITNYGKITTEEILKNELYEEYINENLSLNQLLSLEKEKMFYFISTYEQKVIIADSNIGNKELEFLGYEFSGRRGSAGIKIKKDSNGNTKNKLFNNDLLRDPNKLNTYILRNYDNNLDDIEVSEEIKDYVEIVNLADLFDFTNYSFENNLRYGIHKTKFKGVKTVKLKHYFDSISGVTYKKTDQERSPTNVQILTSTHINLENGKYNLVKPIYLREDFDLPSSINRLRKNDLFISTSNSLKHLGKVALIDQDLDYYSGGFCTILRVKEGFSNTDEITVYVNNILRNSQEFKSFINLYKNSRISNIGSDLLNFRIPLI